MNAAERRRERRINQERLEQQALLQRKPANKTKAQALTDAVQETANKVDEAMIAALKSSTLIPSFKISSSWAPFSGNVVFGYEKPSPIDAAKLAALKLTEPYKVSQRVPDLVQVITAWRAWRVSTENGGWRLKALGQDHLWEPRKAVEAECVSQVGVVLRSTASVLITSKPESHPAPQMNCTCGVWAFKALDSLVQAVGSYDKIQVLGQVSLWGRVVETENGFRAERAYPSELWLLDESLEELGLIYDVPVRMVT